MEKFLAVVLSLILALPLAACGAKEPANDDADLSEKTEIANPFISCDSMEKAAGLAGFEMSIPAALPDWVTETEIQVIEGQMIEVILSDGENNMMRLRKAAGSDDISGDYNEYADTADITIGELTVTLKGNEGKYNTAVWNDGDYAFAVYSAEGLAQDTLSSMIAEIK